MQIDWMQLKEILDSTKWEWAARITEVELQLKKNEVVIRRQQVDKIDYSREVIRLSGPKFSLVLWPSGAYTLVRKE